MPWRAIHSYAICHAIPGPRRADSIASMTTPALAWHEINEPMNQLSARPAYIPPPRVSRGCPRLSCLPCPLSCCASKSRAIVSSAISSSACHTPSPPSSGIAASHSFPNSRSRSPAKLSSKLRLDLPHAPCHQKLREAKLVPGYLLHAASHTSESVLDCPPGTCTLSPLSPTLCPTYPDTPSAQHHHAGAVSTGCRLRLVLDNEQRVRNRRGRPSETTTRDSSGDRPLRQLGIKCRWACT